jgi:hypothetical protein
LLYKLSYNYRLSREELALLNDQLVPFKLLGMRSAQLVPRLGSACSLRSFPKDLLRLVGVMLLL